MKAHNYTGNRVPKGTKRGRKMSQKARDDLARVQALWLEIPDTTIIRTAYLTGIKATLIAEWNRKGYLTRPEVKVVVPPPTVTITQEEVSQAVRDTRVPDDDWDAGPVPTIDSIRREIKRNMRSRILDSLMVSQYATALGRLSGVKEDEGKEDLEQRDLMTIFVPEEDKAPPDA